MIYLKKIMSKIKEPETIKNIGIITLLLYPIISIILKQIVSSGLIAQCITIFIISILTIPGLLIILKNNTKETVIMLLIYLGIIAINYIIHKSTFNNTINIIIKNFVTCYPIFMLTYAVKDKDIFFNALKKGGYVAVILTFVYCAIMNNDKMTLYENGLTIQLILIIFLQVILIYAFKYRKIIDVVFSVAGLVLISSLSSRTVISVIWIFVFFLFVVYYCKWFKKSKKLTLKVISILILVILAISMIIIMKNINSIASILFNYLNSKGLYIRFLRLLSEKQSIFNSSGRTEIVYPVMIKKIMENPIIGQGIGMDRVKIDGHIYYAHNIILELFISYGTIIGSVIIVVLIRLIIEAINTRYKLFVIALVNSGLLILMLTASYMSYRGFWLLLGFLISIYVNKEKDNICECVIEDKKNRRI